MPACRIVNAAHVAQPFIDELKTGVSKLSSPPKLVGFLANSDIFAKKYADWTERSCQQTGIQFELREVSKLDLEEKIDEANKDEGVSGIMIYYPVFGGAQDEYLRNVIEPLKDVEGLCNTFRYNLYHNIRLLPSGYKSVLPCTPLAITKVLEYVGSYNHLLEEGNRMYGKTVAIINRSEVVGRPLAALLSNDGARVYSVDVDDVLLFTRGKGIQLHKHQVSETKETLETVLPQCDVVISGVPVKSYKINSELIKDGAQCVNFSSYNNFNDDIIEHASVLVKSVGKVTVTMLQRNVLRLRHSQPKAQN